MGNNFNNQREFYGPSYQSLKVLGQFKGQLTVKDQSYQEIIFVVRGLKNNLLGLPALTALKLVKRVESTYSSLDDVKKEFPNVFTGLGNFGHNRSYWSQSRSRQD